MSNEASYGRGFVFATVVSAIAGAVSYGIVLFILSLFSVSNPSHLSLIVAFAAVVSANNMLSIMDLELRFNTLESLYERYRDETIVTIARGE